MSTMCLDIENSTHASKSVVWPLAQHGVNWNSYINRFETWNAGNPGNWLQSLPRVCPDAFTTASHPPHYSGERWSSREQQAHRKWRLHQLRLISIAIIEGGQVERVRAPHMHLLWRIHGRAAEFSSCLKAAVEWSQMFGFHCCNGENVAVSVST